MMKKTLLLLSVALVGAAGHAQHYTLSGTAPEGARTVYLTPIGEEDTDSTTADAQGKFAFSTDAQGRHLAYVYTKGGNAARLAVFLEGDITVDLRETTASGSEENRNLSDYQQFVKATTQPLKEVVARLTAKRESGQELNERDLAEYYDLADSLSAIIKERAENDLERHARMRWPAYIVHSQMNDMDPDRLIALDTPANAFMDEPCLNKVKKLIAAYRRTQTGQKFADFEMPDTAGTIRKLSEYAGRGTYVLLDFWATWCGPCMRELPNVKALYDKYHDRGFDIVGISFDTDGDSWRAAIRRKQMDWTHLSDLGGWKSLPVDFYGVRAIPHTILLSPDGTILETNLTGERLAAKLAEIFEPIPGQ